MKAKLKRLKKDTCNVIGAPREDGTVTIDGTTYEQNKPYTITKELYETGLFTQIKEKKEDE